MHTYFRPFDGRFPRQVLLIATGIAVLPSISLASTSASGDAKTFGIATADQEASQLINGANGQAVQTGQLVADTFEIRTVSHATASAFAQEATLKASVSAVADSNGAVALSRGRSQSHASASWDDLLTVTAGSALLGSNGYITATINLSGAYGGTSTLPDSLDVATHQELIRILGTGIDSTGTSSDPQGYCGGWSRCAYNNYADPGFGSNFQFSNISTVIDVKIPFTFGSQTSLRYVLDLTDFAQTNSNAGGIMASAYLDYSQGMTWGGISGVYSSNGAPVSGFTISSASGFNYLYAAPVPEPVGYVLFVVGLGLVNVAVRRSKPLHTSRS